MIKLSRFSFIRLIHGSLQRMHPIMFLFGTGNIARFSFHLYIVFIFYFSFFLLIANLIYLILPSVLQVIYELKAGGIDERRLVGAKLEKLAEGESGRTTSKI